METEKSGLWEAELSEQEKREAFESHMLLEHQDDGEHIREYCYYSMQDCWNAALAYAATQQKWLPISEAPMGESGKPETYFIGARRDGKRVNTATCYRNEHGAYEWWGGGLTPTHWIPLIDLPQPTQPIGVDHD